MSPSSSAVATAVAATARARARVLAVDDETNVLAALRRSLRARGNEVASAEGGAQALEVRVAERTVALQQALERSDLAHQQIKQGFTATMHMLGSLVEARAGLTRGTARRIVEHVQRVGPALGLAGAALQDAIFAAMLVDLGKLLLPERLLQQPCSELVGEDRQQWRAHPQHAHALLLGNPALQGVAELDKALIGQLQRFQTRSETMLSLTVYAPESEPTVPS